MGLSFLEGRKKLDCTPIKEFPEGTQGMTRCVQHPCLPMVDPDEALPWLGQ